MRFADCQRLGLDLTAEESSNAGRLDMALRFNGQVKHLELADLPDLDSEALAALPHEQLRARPEVHKLLAEAEAQLAAHCKNTYGEALKLHTHAAVCVGLLRVVW